MTSQVATPTPTPTTAGDSGHGPVAQPLIAWSPLSAILAGTP